MRRRKVALPFDYFLLFPLQIFCQEPPLVLGKTILLDRLSYFRHHIHVEMHVVDAGKDCGEHLVGVEQVVQVGPGEVAQA